MEDKTVLIHVGYQKTATTWLQQSLFTADNDTFYPLSNSTHGESTLAWGAVLDQQGYPLSPFVSNQAVFQSTYETIRHERAKDDRIPVISNERLVGHPYSAGYDARSILDRLHAALPEAKILIVIREQTQMIRSTYFQYLTAGGSLSIGNFLHARDNARRPEYAPTYFEYDLLIKAYQQKFGTDRVLVLPYELFRDDKPQFFSRLGEWVGAEIALPVATYNRKYNTKHNQWVNYHLRHLSYCTHRNVLTNHSRLCNRFTKPPTKWLKRNLARLVPANWDRQTNEEVAQTIREHAQQRYEASNDRTSILTGLNLAGYGYASSQRPTAG